MEKPGRMYALLAVTLVLIVQPTTGNLAEWIGGVMKDVGGVIKGTSELVKHIGDTLMLDVDISKCHGSEGTLCSHYIPPSKWGEWWKLCECDKGLYCHPIHKRCYSDQVKSTETPTVSDIKVRPRPTTERISSTETTARNGDEPTTLKQHNTSQRPKTTSKISTSSKGTTTKPTRHHPTTILPDATITTKLPKATTTSAPPYTTNTASATTAMLLDCEKLKNTRVCTDMLDILEYSSDPTVEQYYNKYCVC